MNLNLLISLIQGLLLSLSSAVLLFSLPASAATPSLPSCNLGSWNWSQAFTDNGGQPPLTNSSIFTIAELAEMPGALFIANGVSGIEFSGSETVVMQMQSDTYQQLYDGTTKEFQGAFTGSGAVSPTCVTYANNVTYDPSFTAPHYPVYSGGGGGGGSGGVNFVPEGATDWLTASLFALVNGNVIAILGILFFCVAVYFIMRWFRNGSYVSLFYKENDSGTGMNRRFGGKK